MREQRRVRLASRPLDLWQHNGTWTLQGTRLVNTPTLGSELLTDGAFENWTTATNATSWTEAIAGTSTINKETVDMHGGAAALRFDVDGSNSNATITQSAVLAIGTWYQILFWAKANVAAKNVGTNTGIFPAIALTTSYVQYLLTGRSATTAFDIKRNVATSSSVYIDDVSAKALTLNTLFAVRTGVSLPASVSAAGTIAAGTIAGVVYGLDSISAPTNMLLATHDGITGIKLEKLVAGVWTTLVNTAATYVAAVLPQIKWVSANTFGLWYNGVQRGTNQSVSDAGTGLLHGVINTYSGNAITGVFVS